MSKRADELKAAMVRKAEERHEEVAEIGVPVDEDPEFLDEEEPDYGEEEEYEPMTDEEVAEHTADEFLYEAQAEVAQEAGFEAFLNGAEFEANPFLKDESILEDLAEDEANVLVEGWNVGWTEGYKEAWTAEVTLGAKSLVETGSADDAEAILEHLTEAVGVLGELIDYEAYAAFWTLSDK